MSDENSELLSSLLGMLGDNPEEKIKNALSSLTNSEEKTENENQGSGFDIDSMLKIGSLLSSANASDERTSLLCALKPFLSEEKRPKVDSALKILKLANMAKIAQDADILKNFKL